VIPCTGTLAPSQVRWLADHIPAFGDLCRAGAEFRARAAEVAIARADDQEIAARKRGTWLRSDITSVTTLFSQIKVRR
jgi:hypothetical protein